jgi:hypothetical protein
MSNLTDITLLDLARELRVRGRGVEADYWMTTIPTMLYYKGLNLEDIYAMTMSEIEWEFKKPVAPEGWDNTIWGKMIVCPQ